MKTDTGRDLQRDHAGRLRHLLTLEGLARDEIVHLLDLAQFYVRRTWRPAGAATARSPASPWRTCSPSPSTRTRVSFELAAKRLGADVVNLEMQLSSRVKGETMLDTIYTLRSLHVDVFVMRDAEAGVPAFVAAHVQPHVSVLYAGEAHVAHPTQGLLDALTILPGEEEVRWPESRSWATSALACRALGLARAADARRRRNPLRRPRRPCARSRANSRAANAARRSTPASRGADVIMMLRIQKERMDQSQIPDADRYFAKFGLSRSAASCRKQARRDRPASAAR